MARTHARPDWMLRTLTLGVEITYAGVDGGRHYARVTAVHNDGTVTISRGYYGESRVTLTAADDVRDYRTGDALH